MAKYREAFGIELPRKIPTVGAGGYGYPAIAACEPWGSPLPELDDYFHKLLAMRKQYQSEYKASVSWPIEYGKTQGRYPTWEEIAERFPVLGNWLQKQEKQEPTQ